MLVACTPDYRRSACRLIQPHCQFCCLNSNVFFLISLFPCGHMLLDFRTSFRWFSSELNTAIYESSLEQPQSDESRISLIFNSRKSEHFYCFFIMCISWRVSKRTDFKLAVLVLGHDLWPTSCCRRWITTVLVLRSESRVTLVARSRSSNAGHQAFPAAACARNCLCLLLSQLPQNLQQQTSVTL